LIKYVTVQLPKLLIKFNFQLNAIPRSQISLCKPTFFHFKRHIFRPIVKNFNKKTTLFSFSYNPYFDLLTVTTSTFLCAMKLFWILIIAALTLATQGSKQSQESNEDSREWKWFKVCELCCSPHHINVFVCP
jgi:hypothetical protein